MVRFKLQTRCIIACMSWLTTLFKDLGKVFSSSHMQAVEQQIATLVPIALPIVEGIGAMTPNRTVQEITAAYEKYGVPFAANVASDPATALRNLAVAILQKNHAPAAAVSLLNTVVELAVQGLAGKQAAA